MEPLTDPHTIILTKEEIFAILDAHVDRIEEVYFGNRDPDDIMPLMCLLRLL